MSYHLIYTNQTKLHINNNYINVISIQIFWNNQSFTITSPKTGHFSKSSIQRSIIFDLKIVSEDAARMRYKFLNFTGVFESHDWKKSCRRRLTTIGYFLGIHIRWIVPIYWTFVAYLFFFDEGYHSYEKFDVSVNAVLTCRPVSYFNRVLFLNRKYVICWRVLECVIWR